MNVIIREIPSQHQSGLPASMTNVLALNRGLIGQDAVAVDNPAILASTRCKSYLLQS